MEKLNNFTSKDDDYRLWMEEVIYQDGYLYATDSTIIVRKKSEPRENKHVCKFDLNTYFITGKEVHNIDTNKLIDTIKEIHTTDIYDDKEVDCVECGGEGEVFCDCCDFYNECRTCHGEGINLIKGSEVVDKGYIKDIRIHDTFLSTKKMMKIVDNFSEDLCLITTNEKNRIRFRSGEYEILIMGLNWWDDYIEFKL